MLIKGEPITNLIAAGAATNFVWLPAFTQWAQLAATILGIVWLTIQIYYKVRKGQ